MVKAITNDGQLVRKGPYVQLLYRNMCLWASPGDERKDPPRYYADPFLLKGLVFPHNNRTVGDMIEITPYMIYGWLLTLERMRFIRFYPVDEKDYLVLLRYTVELSKPGVTELPKPAPGYTQERYIPTFERFTDELPTDELPFEGDPGPDEPPGDDTPEPPPADTNNECCLAGDANRYGLDDAGFNRAITPYCEVRRRRAWCFGRDRCDKAIMAVIKRVKKRQDVRDYPSYLMSALQEHLDEDADTIRLPGVPYSTGPGG